jgi:ABC-type multidrug transport system fused ATPase/permease subunit
MTAEEMKEILEFKIEEGGNNFSLGERQLICLARALIRKAKILIMDEATASIDEALDLKIQEMIRNEFKDVTVITIAHRLKTIIQYDRILVLDDGKLSAFDSPHNLIKAEKGIFYELLKENGTVFFHDMKKIAEKADIIRE